jgi:hypothetical protein
MLPDSFSGGLNFLLNFCDCSASGVGSERSSPESINSLLAPSVLFTCSLIICFLLLRSLPFQPAMGRGKRGRSWPRHADGKRKRAPSPPSEDFGNSEYSEEASSEYDQSPAPASPVASSEDSDDSMGLSTATRAYWRSIERAGLGGLDESEEVSSEEVDSSEEWSGDDGDGEGDGSSGDDGKGDGDGNSGDGHDGGDVSSGDNDSDGNGSKGDGDDGNVDGSKGDGDSGNGDGSSGKGDGGEGDGDGGNGDDNSGKGDYGKGDGGSGKTSGIMPLV